MARTYGYCITHGTFDSDNISCPQCNGYTSVDEVVLPSAMSGRIDVRYRERDELVLKLYAAIDPKWSCREALQIAINRADTYLEWKNTTRSQAV